MLAVDAAPLLMFLCWPHWRQHRETLMVARSTGAMVAALGWLVTASKRHVATHTFRQVLPRFWGLVVFRICAVPLTQQLTLRNHLLAMPAYTFRWGVLQWFLLPRDTGTVQFALVLACSNVAAALLALVFDWHWRTVFVRRAVSAAATVRA